VSELLTFIELGFRHITNVQALDHMLFLLALAAIYRPRDWHDALWVVSAFTVGHSITLALAVTGALTLPTSWIEFLIPVTIVATGAENILVRERGRAPLRGRYRPIFAATFGLVHGAGFANSLRSLFTGSVAKPLFGFNVGIELGQIVVLAAIAGLLVGVDRLLVGHTRWRVVGVSAAVVLVAARMAVARSPW
jgi:HupE / UreJ protein